jgi:hypothetical protein
LSRRRPDRQGQRRDKQQQDSLQRSAHVELSLWSL